LVPVDNPYPLTLDDLVAKHPQRSTTSRRGHDDQTSPVDLIQSFTIFGENDKGYTIKVVARYQQVRAVKKTIQRLLEGKNAQERSGIIWHTQGSGKSLTMMFMVREMRNISYFNDWKVVFVTDRTQLEDQLRSGRAIKTVKVAGGSTHIKRPNRSLKELLKTDTLT
jgi:type I restriction enzyme R subunit